MLPQLWLAASGLGLALVLSVTVLAGWAAPGEEDPADPVIGSSVGAGAEGRIDFNRDIRPILVDRCFPCHGPDRRVVAQTGGLRLDSFEAATAQRDNGRFPIVPGHPELSEMMRRVRHADPEERMPPPEMKLSVSEAESELLERWIGQGAEYAEHWAFVPPSRPDLPPVDADQWPRNAIDRFVLARLEDAGFDPSPEANRETLIRRASLDLTGLPPTPEEIDAFLADNDPGAYGRVVDRLLASPHFGERMAMLWLDIARYADTNGYHHDNYRTQWPWRDWVIRAFNDNKPYDEFVVEQLAGDLLPDGGLDERIATGFCRNHPMTDEGGAIDQEYLVEYAADRVVTTSTAFMAITMNCARCHDHKYDPFTMEDFYGMFAFFNSIEERGLNDLSQGIRDFAFPPFVEAPTDRQRATLERLRERIETTKASLDGPLEGIDEEQSSWEQTVRAGAGVAWADAEVVEATSKGGATLTPRKDGSVLATGANPQQDVFEIRLRTGADQLRLLRLEAMEDESLPTAGPGRAHNGNAVLTGVEVEARSLADPGQAEAVPLAWAWATHEQQNGDFGVLRAIDDDRASGWAIDAHRMDGPRTALFLADDPFGFEGGTEILVRLRFESIYTEHTLGRVRLTMANAGEEALATLPTVWRDWFSASPFKATDANTAFATRYGPEGVERIDLDDRFSESGKAWTHQPSYADGEVHVFEGERSAFYFGRQVFSPVARTIQASLGSDDTLSVHLNGAELLANNTRRGPAPDQDRVMLPLRAGENALVLKVVNDGGPAGLYFQRDDTATDSPSAADALALIEPDRRTPHESDLLRTAFREGRSPTYRALQAKLQELETELAEVESRVPNVMVMQERPEPRETFVLTRGAYDDPDPSRPVQRRAPEALGSLADHAPRDRLGLAQWLVSDKNPLVARVAVNRFWQLVFGLGIVKTSEDFGSQGEWPSHPDLLDWLAVEFRESGWDVKQLMRLIVTSATYRQSSAYRPTLAEIDPENRLIGWFPRLRLSAELVRDNALAASGLLNPRIGGPSVKPYQPMGLWRERAMGNSNTRVFERDDGPDLYRRGMYTFWKRSAPPPQMSTFDAPEREFCVVQRSRTNTPLQALVLLNDETYLEIARALAQRAMLETAWNDTRDVEGAIERMFRLATGRRPLHDERGMLVALFAESVARTRQDPESAERLLSYGEAERDESLEPPEHAAMTMVASVVLNLDETVTRD